jgi:hypothetical protein
MKRGLAVALGVCAVVAATRSAHADLSVGAGFENFRWKESTSPSVKESGLRWVLDLTWSQNTQQPGPSVAYNLKLYTGNVDYTGALLSSNAPISGETHYRGLQNELQAIYRTVGGVNFVLAAGWDHWRRNLTAAQEETWDVLYAKLGAAMNAPAVSGPFGGAGVKYPVYTRENAHLTDLGATSNPRLRPRGNFSLYGTLGYRVNPGWDVMAYYDMYRFRQSNIVTVSNGTVFQPKSRQDVLGLKVQHNF